MFFSKYAIDSCQRVFPRETSNNLYLSVFQTPSMIIRGYSWMSVMLYFNFLQMPKGIHAEKALRIGNEFYFILIRQTFLQQELDISPVSLE